MNVQEIRKALFHLQDMKYREVQIKTIPTVKPETIIGVRTPDLRKMAKELTQTQGTETFLDDLPHTYFEENQLHAFILSGIKDYSQCMELLKQFSYPSSSAKLRIGPGALSSDSGSGSAVGSGVALTALPSALYMNETGTAEFVVILTMVPSSNWIKKSIVWSPSTAETSTATS